MSEEREPIITRTSVTYSQSRKVNMGNYEGVDIFASITYETVEAGREEELYAKAGDFVEARLAEEEAELQKRSINSTTKKKAEKAEKVSKTAKKDTKAKAKVSKKAKDDANEEDAESSDITVDDIKSALREYSTEYSKADAKALLERVGGAKKIADVDEDRYSAILVACENPPVEEDDEEDEAEAA